MVPVLNNHLMALLEHALELCPVEINSEVLVVPSTQSLSNLVAEASLESILVQVLNGCCVHFRGYIMLLFNNY